MRIGVFQTSDGMFGGLRYEIMVMEALSTGHSVYSFDARPRFWLAERPQSLFTIPRAERRARVDLWIRVGMAVAGMTARSRKSKNITLAHHIEKDAGPFDWFNSMLHRRWLDGARASDRVVVVSKFWRDYLKSEGIEHVDVIHNGFDVDLFDVTEEEIDAFKEAYNLHGRPIVYIGNCQHRKGAPEVYEALKEAPYHLVTSGFQNVKLPVRRFALSYRDYITLLTACDVVVTMSTFPEGWTRTAHEALLCRTPVIGSGAGGMGELLEGAGQHTCTDPKELLDLIPAVMEDSVMLGARGYAFASTFNYEMFAQQWVNLIASLED